MCFTETTGTALSLMSRSTPGLEITVGVLAVPSLITITTASLICTLPTTLTSTLRPTPTAHKKAWRPTAHRKVLRVYRTPYIATTATVRSPMSPPALEYTTKMEKGWASCSEIMTTTEIQIVTSATMPERISSIKTRAMVHLQTSVGWQGWRLTKTETYKEQWGSISGITTTTDS